MKKFFTLLALALTAVSANAQKIEFSADGGWVDWEKVTVVPKDPDGKYGKVVVNMKNDVEIGGYQFMITVPAGCTVLDFAADNELEDGNDYLAHYPTKEVKKGTKTIITNTWTIGTTKAENKENTWVVTAYYEAGNPMLPTAMSPLGYFYVEVPDDFEGPATIDFSVAKASDPAATTIAEEDGTTERTFSAELVAVSTGIKSVSAETLTGKEIFNLSGQRISKPSQRGIYIVDGKKVMIK